MKSIFPTLLCCSLLFLLSACQKDDDNRLVRLRYDTTQCADIWWANCRSQDYELCFQNFWLNQGVEIENYKRRPIDGNFLSCLACHCSDNYYILVRVKAIHQDQFEELGFYQ